MVDEEEVACPACLGVDSLFEGVDCVEDGVTSHYFNTLMSCSIKDNNLTHPSVTLKVVELKSQSQCHRCSCAFLWAMTQKD